jgi:alkyl sulfatase BDS1-like metallo-beta-lactamase superfamily hydrolase
MAAVKSKKTETTAEKSVETAKPAEKSATKTTPKKKTVSYETLVKTAAEKLGAADVKGIKYRISANIHLDGTWDGDFYVLIDGGKVSVEPYDYKDADIFIKSSPEEMLKVLSGETKIVDSIKAEKLEIWGNAQKSILLVAAAFCS